MADASRGDERARAAYRRWLQEHPALSTARALRKPKEARKIAPVVSKIKPSTRKPMHERKAMIVSKIKPSTRKPARMKERP